MKKWTDAAGRRAAGTAALLLVTGGVMGVVVDRLWLSPPETHAAPLTAEAMVARLGLSSGEEAHVRALLDSLHTEIVAVVQQSRTPWGRPSGTRSCVSKRPCRPVPAPSSALGCGSVTNS